MHVGVCVNFEGEATIKNLHEDTCKNCYYTLQNWWCCRTVFVFGKHLVKLRKIGLFTTVFIGSCNFYVGCCQVKFKFIQISYFAMCTAWEKHILQINRHSNLSTSLCYLTIKKTFSKVLHDKSDKSNKLKWKIFFFITLYLSRKVLLNMVVVSERYDLFPPIFCVTFIIYGLMHDYFLAKVKLYYYC